MRQPPWTFTKPARPAPWNAPPPTPRPPRPDFSGIMPKAAGPRPPGRAAAVQSVTAAVQKKTKPRGAAVVTGKPPAGSFLAQIKQPKLNAKVILTPVPKPPKPGRNKGSFKR